MAPRMLESQDDRGVGLHRIGKFVKDQHTPFVADCCATASYSSEQLAKTAVH